MPEFARCMEKFSLNSMKDSLSIELTDDEQARISHIIKKVKELDQVIILLSIIIFKEPQEKDL